MNGSLDKDFSGLLSRKHHEVSEEKRERGREREGEREGGSSERGSGERERENERVVVTTSLGIRCLSIC